MKFRLDFIIAAVVLVVIVITSISSSVVDYVPYNSNPMHAYHFSREGFAGLNYSSVSGDSSSTGGAPIGYSDFASSGNVTTSAPSSSINTTAKVEGFQGLQSAPFVEEKPIDIYSQNKGSNDCPPNPYSNSKGYLCMSEGEINLLKTRGGNQSAHFSSGIGH